jgi:hypothetical protein
MDMQTVFCPVKKNQIDGGDCFDAALVYEDMSPLSELPDDMPPFSEETCRTCMKCEWHLK